MVNSFSGAEHSVSLIFPVYDEESNIGVLYERLNSVVSKISGCSFEFVFVDDCSLDKTPEILKSFSEKDKRIKIIRFARNCGSHAALAAGLYDCRGSCAIGLAADLQDPPEIIVSLIEEWKKGAHIVWGARAKREGESFLTRFFSKLYYAMINQFTNVRMPPLGADVFLADRVVIDTFRQVTEKHSSVFMTLAWLGFKQITIEYVKQARLAGKSKWTLGKKIKLALDSLLAFSDVPIRYMSVFGFFTALLGFLYASFTFWYFLHGSPVTGWTSLMIVILTIGGVQMIMLGVLGEYLWRTFDESRGRPRYIIEYKIGWTDNRPSVSNKEAR